MVHIDKLIDGLKGISDEEFSCQNVYEWRGADASFLLGFVAAYPTAPCTSVMPSRTRWCR